MFRYRSIVLFLLSIVFLLPLTSDAAKDKFSWPGWRIPGQALEERGALSIIEDEDAASKRPVEGKDGKKTEVKSALQQRVSRRAIAKKPIIVARTPELKWRDIEPGVYKVSARINYDGDTGLIGTPIRLSVNLPTVGKDISRDFSATDLKQPGEYQTISFLYEVSPEGDKRLTPRIARHPWSTSRWLEDVYPNCEQVKERKEKESSMKKQKGLVITLSLPKTKYLSKEGMPPNSLRWVRVDSIAFEKIDPSPSITVRAVRPKKLWMRPGMENGFDVYVENFTNKPWKRTLTVTLEWGLDSKKAIYNQEVELASGKNKKISVPWQTTKDTPQFGYRVIAEIKDGDKVESFAQDYFQVHPRCYTVHISGSQIRSVDPFRQRESYKNLQEVFAATPGDMARILPKGDAWISGMSGGNVVYTYKTVRATTDHNRENGIQTAMYLFSGGTGTPTMDMHIAHPEWVSQKVVSTDQVYNIMRERENAVASWDWEKKGMIPSREGGCPTLEQHLNHRWPALLKQIEEQLVAFVKKTGYGAVRFDVGIMPPSSGNKSILGTECSVKIKDHMAQAAKNFNSLRKVVESKYPDFEWGANMDSYQYLETITERDAPIKPAETYPEFVAFAQAHGMFEDEGTMSAPFYDHYMNRWEDAWYFMNLKRAICRKYGGGVYQLFSPHRDGKGHFNHDDVYFTLMTIASGSHYVGNYSAPPYSEDSMGAFATRFSEFFWDEKLKPLKNAEDAIYVDSPSDLWYADGVTQRDIGSKRRYVIPLINPPVVERLRRNKSNELPPPIEEEFDIEVGIPEGFSKGEAWQLSWEPKVHAKRIKSEVDGETLKIKHPPFKLFSTLVVEFAK